MTRLQAPATATAPLDGSAPQADAAMVLAGERPVAGGDAWVVAHEPGAPVWMSASAPQIALTDQRLRATRAR